MSNLKIHLPTRSEAETVSEYVENKLAPLAAELHRLVNQQFSNGLSETDAMDMKPKWACDEFKVCNELAVQLKTKRCRFRVNTTEFPPLQNGKRLKILWQIECFSEFGELVEFRLAKANKEPMDGALLMVERTECARYDVYLPFGDQPGRISSHDTEYVVEARYVSKPDTPIVRRFSLSAVYV